MDHRHLLMNAWRMGHEGANMKSREVSEETSVDSGVHMWTSTQTDYATHELAADMSLFPASTAAAYGHLSAVPSGNSSADQTSSGSAFMSASASGSAVSANSSRGHHTSFMSLPHAYHMPHLPNSQLWALHMTPTLQISEAAEEELDVNSTDIDVVTITENTRDVRITSYDEENGNDAQDQPLDLSVRRPSPSPSSSASLHHYMSSPAPTVSRCSLPQHSPSPSFINSPSPTPTSSSLDIGIPDRPSVIMPIPDNARVPPSVRRSASSVTPQSSQPAVQEHFRRSLSGKWPRRTKQDDEKNRSSPFPRKPSLNSLHTATHHTTREPKIIEHCPTSIEEHFRKALNPEAFNKWKMRKEE